MREPLVFAPCVYGLATFRGKKLYRQFITRQSDGLAFAGDKFPNGGMSRLPGDGAARIRVRAVTGPRPKSLALLSLMLAALAPAGVTRAHGDPPQALSIVAIDQDGVSAVRLNEGLGLRDAGGFRYLCPALWGADIVTPALAIPAGPIVVGADSGLFLVDHEGRVERHPDPNAAAATATLTESDDGLFALQSGDVYRVLKVEADRVQVLWSGTERWYDLAAGEGFLQLVRLESNQLHTLRLSPAGEVLLEQSAPAPEGTRSVLARVAGSRAYIVAYAATLAAQLGRIEDGAFVAVDSAQLLVGPIEVDEGKLLVAHDQQLFSFDDERAEPRAEPRPIACLRRNFGFGYACSSGGLHAVDASGLTGSLFELDQLREPDLSSVPEALREACMLQWQRYQIDLISIGLQPPGQSDGGLAMAGEGGAGTPAPDAGAGVDAGAEPLRRDDGGCRAAGADAGGSNPWFVLAALLWIRRLRTDRPRPCRRRRTS